MYTGDIGRMKCFTTTSGIVFHARVVMVTQGFYYVEEVQPALPDNGFSRQDKLVLVDDYIVSPVDVGGVVNDTPSMKGKLEGREIEVNFKNGSEEVLGKLLAFDSHAICVSIVGGNQNIGSQFISHIDMK